MRNIENISVFVTNVLTTSDVDKLSASLNAICGIGAWSFDLEDKDCVLRIESTLPATDAAIAEIRKHGYNCSEMEELAFPITLPQAPTANTFCNSQTD